MKTTPVRIAPINQRDAKAFINKHHRHNKAPRGMKFAISLRDTEGNILGVVTAGRPVYFAFNPDQVIEINRLCVLDGAPLNCCSMLYAAARKCALAMGYQRIITYTLSTETGSSLKASGFRIEYIQKRAGAWSSKNRPRQALPTDNIFKVRWVYP